MLLLAKEKWSGSKQRAKHGVERRKNVLSKREGRVRWKLEKTGAVYILHILCSYMIGMEGDNGSGEYSGKEIVLVLILSEPNDCTCCLRQNDT